MRRGTRAAALVGIALFLAAGCSSGGGPGEARPGQRPRTQGPSAGAERTSGEATALRPASGLLLGTPVYPGDFADPFVLHVGDRYYAYATNTEDANVPVMVVENSPLARYLGDALPTVAPWSEPGHVWAPAVLALDDGYVLYYTTRLAGTETQCISAATSTDPAGPFVDESTAPLVCQRDLGGSIDPSVVEDGGDAWLLFKNDGNCCDLPTSIWIQRLAPDGLSVQGSPVELLEAGPDWEGGLVEAPSMLLAGDRAYLFYSANAWDSDDYAIGYAVCDSVTGPCHRPESVEDGPWMGSTRFARGPGGQEFFGGVGQVWMVYHGWSEGDAGEPGGERRLYVDIVELHDGVPTRVGAERAGRLLLAVVAALAVVVAAVVALVWWRRRRRRARERPAV